MNANNILSQTGSIYLTNINNALFTYNEIEAKVLRESLVWGCTCKWLKVGLIQMLDPTTTTGQFEKPITPEKHSHTCRNRASKVREIFVENPRRKENRGHQGLHCERRWFNICAIAILPINCTSLFGLLYRHVIVGLFDKWLCQFSLHNALHFSAATAWFWIVSCTVKTCVRSIFLQNNVVVLYDLLKLMGYSTTSVKFNRHKACKKLNTFNSIHFNERWFYYPYNKSHVLIILYVIVFNRNPIERLIFFTQVVDSK